MSARDLELASRGFAETAATARSRQAPVGADVPSSLKEAEYLETWEEIAAELEGPNKSSIREKVSAHIRYRLDWVRQHPLDTQVE